MKYLLTFLCLAAGCATIPATVPTSLHYEFINDHSLSKDAAYDATVLWLARTVDKYDDKKSFKLKNKESGVLLIDLGYYNEHKETVDDNVIDYFKNYPKRDPDNRKYINYQLEVVVKDNKVKYTFDIGTLRNSARYPTGKTIHIMSRVVFPEIVSKINAVLQKSIDNF